MLQPSSKWTVQALRNRIRAMANMTSDRQTLLLVYRILKSSASMRQKIAEYMETQTEM